MQTRTDASPAGSALAPRAACAWAFGGFGNGHHAVASGIEDQARGGGVHERTFSYADYLKTAKNPYLIRDLIRI